MLSHDWTCARSSCCQQPRARPLSVPPFLLIVPCSSSDSRQHSLRTIAFLLPGRARRMSFFRKRQTTHAPSSSTQVTVVQPASAALAQTEKGALAQQQQTQVQAQQMAREMAKERDGSQSSVHLHSHHFHNGYLIVLFFLCSVNSSVK